MLVFGVGCEWSIPDLFSQWCDNNRENNEAHLLPSYVILHVSCLLASKLDLAINVCNFFHRQGRFLVDADLPPISLPPIPNHLPYPDSRLDIHLYSDISMGLGAKTSAPGFPIAHLD